ncbi:YjbH domain-containing protein [Colwellia psychrerythraea]|uniref:Lipoprotein n=1 Tax=Colwellia psychrerythraea (strain 34H / ATCC BAA-681) TaxID=167879 RepID=Q489E5_COLP3|nr:YjbH domain-containing protein [Colwellia psychrerythraea]AAZ28515.1 hypothetical protein CPS_0569 [Colwellia psychrerythraea 34H]
MKRCILLALALLPSITVTAEPEATMSFQGYSGLINTPTATLFEEGKFFFQYGNQVETRTGAGYRNGDNYNFGVGLWKYVEVSGRLADYKHGSEDGLTDLSANIKLGIPFIPKDWFSLAVGIQDVGGAANFYDAKYAVASKNIFEAVNLSLGIGTSVSTEDRLNGFFAGIEWQPYNWVKLSAEYDAADTQFGLHLSSPKGWLYSGVQLTSDILVSSTNQALKDDFYYGLGFTIPLGGEGNQSNNNNRMTASSHESSHLDDLDSGAASPSGTAERLRVKELLVKEGFEAISIGETDGNTLYVELENHVYNRNQIDGLGVVLGVISKQVQHNYANFKLVLKERQIPILVVKGSLAEYDAFLRDNQPLKLDISTDTFGSQRRDSTLDLNDANSIWFKPRFTFWPGLVTRVGTEFGTFDASLALISHVEVPLWPGAAVTAQHTKQVAETKNFEDGEYFSDYKQKTGLKEYSFHQTFSLPYSIKNMSSVGRYRDTYDYLSNEVRWQSYGGSHKINLFTARYENQEPPEREHYNGCNILFPACWKEAEPLQRDVVIAKYLYYNAHFNASAEMQVGQFWQQDKGVVVKLERMFGDVTLNLTYKDTKVDNEEANQFIGLGFSIPLTPRKDYNNKYFQVRGKPKWRYSVNTLVGKDHNRLTPGTGDTSQRFYNLDSAFYNNNRLSSEYIYGNANRLREAYYHAR